MLRSKGGIDLKGTSEGRELAIIQRIYDHDHNQSSVFICAGTGSNATYGIVKFLQKNWKKLYGKYKCDEFALCLAYPGIAPDSETPPPVGEFILVYQYPDRLVGSDLHFKD